jgi:hypothetical protein
MKKLAMLLLLSSWPQHAAAMTIDQFDRMVVEDRRHYVMFLVREAKKLLIDQGQPELARNVERLFHEIPSGEDRSPGERQFEASMAAARVATIRMSLWHEPSGEVEFVFVDALLRRGLKPAPAFMTHFGPATHNRAFFQKELSPQP